MDKEKLSKSISNLKNLEEKFIAERKGEFNILYEIGRDDRENYNSDILAFLLDPSREHFHPEYFTSFLKRMNLELPKNPGSVVVTREKSTDKNRRIDIVIESDMWILGIECKINDTERDDQLHDYAEDLISKAKQKNKKPHLFFLTRSSAENTSLTAGDQKKISYKNITWGGDILPWLEKLTVKVDEELLKSGLRQYKDSVEIFTNEKDWGHMTNEILKLFFEGGDINKPVIKEHGMLNDLTNAVEQFQYLVTIHEAAKKVSKDLGQLDQNIELVLGTSDDSLKTVPFTFDEFMKNNHYWVGCKIPSNKGDIYLAYDDKIQYYYVCAKDEASFIKGIKKIEFADDDKYPWIWLADFGSKLNVGEIVSLIR